MICSQCSIERQTKGGRLPKGWKRSGGDIYCAKCWASRTVLRAIAMPVAEPLDGLTWKELDTRLRRAWADTTHCANWMMTELYAQDVRRNGEEKMPPMQRVYLYPDARKRFPNLPSQSVAALEQATQAKYRAKRYEVLWTCASSLPTYRYPTPFSIPNQGWSVELLDEKPVVSIRLGDGRVRLRLKTGPQFRRQLVAVRQISKGDALQGSLDVYRKPDAIMVKMVAYLPRGESRGAEGTLRVRSTAESLLVALNEKDEKIWTYHADHLRRWSAEHRQQLQRWADDSKFEHRPVPSFSERREAAARKYRDRMSSVIRETAAALAGYAERRKFAIVEYDDSERSFCLDLPWFMLAERVKIKLDEVGIEFASATAAVKSGGSLAEVKTK